MKQTSTNPTTQANRRYVLEFSIAIAAYVIVLFGTRFAFGSYHGPWLPAVALAPATPVLFVFLAGYRLYRTTDEFAQRMMTESLAIAGVITALAAVTYGFLQNDLLPRPSAWWVWSLFMGAWAVSSIVLRRRFE